MTPRVYIGASFIPDERWDRVKPTGKQPTSVRCVPRAGFVGAVVAFFKLAGSVLVSKFGTSAFFFNAIRFGITSFSVISANRRPSGLNLGGGGVTGRISPSLNGVGNDIRKYAPLPDVIGVHRIFPPLIAFPFTEQAGSQTFVRLLFGVTHGPATVPEDQQTIGGVFVDTLPNVTRQTREGTDSDPAIKIYTNQVFESQPQINFPLPFATEAAVGTAQIVQVAGTGVEEISFDLSFDGLMRFNESGRPRPYSVGFRAQYRPQSGGAWTNVSAATGFSAPGFAVRSGASALEVLQDGDLSITGQTQQPFKRTIRFEVTADDYELLIQMRDPNPANARPGGADASAVQGSFVLSAVRGFKFVAPFSLANYATVALRVEITDQLQGSIGAFSCLVKRKLRAYDPLQLYGVAIDADGWTSTPVPTTNPASALRYVFQGQSNLRPVPDSQLDIAALTQFAIDCDPSQFNALDSTSGWTAIGLTLALETTIKQEGTGALKGTSNDANPCQMRLGGLSYNGLNEYVTVLCHVPTTNGTGLTAIAGVSVRLYSSAETDDNFAEWDFGSDDIVLDDYVKLVCVPNQQTRTFGSFDASNIQGVGLVHNTVNGASGKLVYWDDLHIGVLLEYHDVWDFGATAFERGKIVAESGFADLDDDGQIGVVVSKEQTILRGILAPRNYFDFGIQQGFPEEVHAFRVNYTGIEQGYDAQQQLIVYDDGYSELGGGGTVAATLFETISLVGAMRQVDAWVRGRRFLAERRRRTRVVTLSQDMEGLTLARGQLAGVVAPEALLGQDFGRIQRAESATTLNAADSLTGWTGINATLALDTGDFQEGTASIASTCSSTGVYGARYTFGSQNWTDLDVRFWERLASTAIINATDGVRLFVGTDTSNGVVFYLGVDDTVRSGRWRRIQIDPSGTADATVGAGLTITNVTVVEITTGHVVSAAAGEVLKVDLLETLDQNEVATIETDGPVTFESDQSYSISVRKIDTANLRFQVVEAAIVNPLSPGADPVELTTLTLVTPLTSSPLPAAGDIFAFGQTGFVTIPMVVRSIARSPELVATLTLVDHATEIFDAHKTLVPTFPPITSQLVQESARSPADPVIASVITDERALALTDSGTLVPRIILEVDSAPNAPGVPIAETLDIQIRQVDEDLGIETAWKPLPSVLVSPQVIISDVDEGSTYDIQLRAVSRDGRRSNFVLVPNILVTGKTNPPADVVVFRIENDTLTWDYDFTLIDLDGFQIRSNPGVNFQFEVAQSLHGEMLVKSPPFSLAGAPRGLTTGTRTFLIKAVDTSGNPSTNAAAITRGSTGSDLANVVQTIDLHAAGFPRVLVPSLIDDCDDVGADGVSDPVAAGTLERAIPPDVYSGSGSYKITTTSGSSHVVIFTLTFGLDYTGRKVRIFARVEASASLSASDGVRVGVGNDLSNYSLWHFGTDDGLAADGNFHELIADTDDTPDSTVGSLDITDVGLVLVFVNTVGGATDRVFYLDELEAEDGTVETTVVESPSGDLVTRGSDTFWKDDSAPFWSGVDSATFWTSVYQKGTYHFALTPGGEVVPARLSFNWNDPGVPGLLEYRRIEPPVAFWDKGDSALFWDKADSDLFWEPQTTRDEFQPFPGRLAVLREPFEFRLTLQGGRNQGRVTQLDAVFDVLDIVERFEDLAIPSFGLRVPITQPFRVIVGARWVVQDGPGTLQLLDKAIQPGPLVQVQNDAGTGVARVVDLEIVGY